jgi:hypothetical protein
MCTYNYPLLDMSKALMRDDRWFDGKPLPLRFRTGAAIDPVSLPYVDAQGAID